MAEQEYSSLRSPVKGVLLRVVKGVESLEVPPKTIEQLVMEGRELDDIRDRLEILKGEEKTRKAKIRRIVSRYVGLAGVITAGLSLLVFPKKTKSWEESRDVLKKDLGPNYPSIVKETLTLKMPLGSIDGVVIKENAILGAIVEKLAELGLSRRKARDLISSEISLKVDEADLEEGAHEGKWPMPILKEKETWAVKTD